MEFDTTVECGGDYIDFIVNTTDLDSGSYAKLYVFDPYTQEWITDDGWEEAGAYASYHFPDISFEDGFYSVYMAYAQWTDNGWGLLRRVHGHLHPVLRGQLLEVERLLHGLLTAHRLRPADRSLRRAICGTQPTCPTSIGALVRLTRRAAAGGASAVPRVSRSSRRDHSPVHAVPANPAGGPG